MGAGDDGLFRRDAGESIDPRPTELVTIALLLISGDLFVRLLAKK